MIKTKTLFFAGFILSIGFIININLAHAFTAPSIIIRGNNSIDDFSANAFPVSGSVDGYTTGKIGQAAVFSMNHNIHYEGSPVLGAPNNFTLYSWFNTTSTDVVGLWTIDSQIAFYIDNGSISGGVVGLGGPGSLNCRGSSCADGNWHLAVLTWDGRELVAYVDNVSSTIQRGSPASISMTNWSFASYSESGHYFKGLLDESGVIYADIGQSGVDQLWNHGAGCEVQSDGTCTSGTSALEPVLIVPGLFGSDFKNGQWILQPRLAPYDRLKATLVANGYVQNKTLFDLPYDWEKSNAVTAGLLRDTIRDIKAICGCSKVNLVTHSMGGLVAREYIESDLYQNDVDQLIFLGTPHLGSPISYFAWEGGTTEISGPLDLAGIWMKWMMRGRAVEAGFPIDFAHPDMPIYEYVHSSSSPVLSFQELLPTYDYLRDVDGGVLRTYSNGYPQNVFLDNLNSASSLSSLRQRGIKITNIYSKDQKTTNIIGVKNDSSLLPLWADGAPENYEIGAGDGTVPENSAIAISANDSIEIGGSHFSLPTAAEKQVVQTLTGRTDVATTATPAIKKFLLIMPLSPVDVLVTAPDGLKIGKDFSTGQEINQINGAYYSGSATPDENIFIPNPEDGKYIVTTQGTAPGNYHVLASYGYETPSSATSSDVMFMAKTEAGLIENLDLIVDSSMPTANVMVPQDISPPIISYSRLDPRYLVGSSPIVLTFSATDAGVSVFSVTSTIDGVPISSPVKLDLDRVGSHTIVITASDFVGNTTSTVVNYNVVYGFGGFLPPIKLDGSGIYNFGRTLPIKFQLTDAKGAFVPTATARLIVTKVQGGIIGAAPAVFTARTSNDRDLFRYDSTANQYIYNFDTGRLAVGTWEIKVALDDGSNYPVTISLK